MNKKELKEIALEKLNAGVSKNKVFKELSNETINESQLAWIVASYVPQALANQHRNKIKVLIGISLVQVALGVALGGFALYIGSPWLLFAAFFVICLCLLFANGFYKHKLFIYNLSIFILLIDAYKEINNLYPTLFSISIFTIWMFMLAYTVYVRHLVFPDFRWLFPRKAQGKYVFSS